MKLYAKKNPNGICSEVSFREPTAWADGSVDVEVAQQVPTSLIGRPVKLDAGGNWIDGSTVDDDLSRVPIGPKLLAAVVLALDALPANAKTNWPGPVASIIGNAATRIKAVIAGRTPSGKE